MALSTKNKRKESWEGKWRKILVRQCLSLTHMAMAFVIAHPGVTAALLGPRTMEQLNDLLAGAEVVLSDDVLDRIDVIVPPGTDVGRLEMAYNPPSVVKPTLRRRPIDERTAT
jgi:aryl-alcohol dehydrogenase-like predicted oxidoreductase